MVQQPGDPFGWPVVESIPNVTTPKHWLAGVNVTSVSWQLTAPLYVAPAGGLGHIPGCNFAVPFGQAPFVGALQKRSCE
jgi:hypothetical protein